MAQARPLKAPQLGDPMRSNDHEPRRREERMNYHSIPRSIRDMLDVQLPDYSYELPESPSSYDAGTTGYPVIAWYIPRDGRIQLRFDIHLKSKDQSLNPFYGKEFLDFGKLIVCDINPSESTDYLEYNLTRPYLAISGFSKDEMNRGGQHIHNIMSKDGLAAIRSCIDEFARRCEKIQRPGVAPWQRIIVCQGLPFASQDIEENPLLSFLVYDGESGEDPIRRATNLHLSNGRIRGSKTTNPYSDPHTPFHITFFQKIERVSSKDEVKASREKHQKFGYLYEKPQKGGDHRKDNKDLRAFRKSSFTMVATGSPWQEESDTRVTSGGDCYWTMLILSPSFFFFPSPGHLPRIITDKGVSQISQQTAQLSFVVYALNRLEYRWSNLNEYIAGLLVEDFMDPETYTKLLFDDDRFSRSRLYFWIIGCLNEFDVSIEDNIKQSRLFRQGRVEPLLKSLPSETAASEPPDLKTLQDLDKRAQELEQGLEDIQAQFRAKTERVKSLLEALFNASALMESRSSTKLGQNVQLLTYVSIFYLPLGFCAALWAIPDITDSATKIPFVLTACIVGFVTYAIVFNLGNIAKVLGKVYAGYREQILRHMENDENQSWQELRRQFEEFPPNQERQIPSEWRILWYQAHRLFSRRNRRKTAESGDA
jgi:hypothetical protein